MIALLPSHYSLIGYHHNHPYIVSNLAPSTQTPMSMLYLYVRCHGASLKVQSVVTECPFEQSI